MLFDSRKESSASIENLSAATAQQTFSAAQTRGGREPELRHQHERRREHSEHGAERVAGVQRAMDAPSASIAPSTRSIAGNVAPIAAVAGNSSKKVPKKATVQCHTGEGCAPIRSSSKPETGASRTASAKPHAAMTTSHAAYQRAGLRLRRCASSARARRAPGRRRRPRPPRAPQPIRARATTRLLRPHDLVAQAGEARRGHERERGSLASQPLNETR